MTPFTRSLFRRIALGLPLVGLVPAGAALVSLTGCPCPGAGPARRYSITDEEVAAIHGTTGMPDPELCRELCAELVNGLPFGDAGGSDAGPIVLTSDRFEISSCRLVGTNNLECQPAPPQCLGGRAPSGLVASLGAPRSVATHLARSAWFEAASADAFEDLAAELSALGAPRSLVVRAERAADDERRHAARFTGLAAVRGASVPLVHRTPVRRRDLAALALDNAVEGLGREALAALIATHQATHAADADVRAVCAEIAADEAGHALLSADVHAWATAGLDAGPLERARRAMIASGIDAANPPREIAAALGLPDREARRGLGALLG